jgi:hypothetical protein
VIVAELGLAEDTDHVLGEVGRQAGQLPARLVVGVAGFAEAAGFEGGGPALGESLGPLEPFGGEARFEFVGGLLLGPVPGGDGLDLVGGNGFGRRVVGGVIAGQKEEEGQARRQRQGQTTKEMPEGGHEPFSHRKRRVRRFSKLR